MNFYETKVLLVKNRLCTRFFPISVGIRYKKDFRGKAHNNLPKFHSNRINDIEIV